MFKKSGIKYIERNVREGEIGGKELLILLHGYGSDEKDLLALAEEFSQSYYVVSLRALHNCPFGGYAWYDIDSSNISQRMNVEQAQQATNQLVSFIEEMIGIHQLSSKVTLCGFSQGAILSYALALNCPKYIHKIIALSGYLEEALLPNDMIAEQYKALRIFSSHGTEDPIIPVEWARKIPGLMEALDISITYREYSAGHGINPQNYSDMLTFINESHKHEQVY